MGRPLLLPYLDTFPDEEAGRHLLDGIWVICLVVRVWCLGTRDKQARSVVKTKRERKEGYQIRFVAYLPNGFPGSLGFDPTRSASTCGRARKEERRQTTQKRQLHRSRCRSERYSEGKPEFVNWTVLNEQS